MRHTFSGMLATACFLFFFSTAVMAQGMHMTPEQRAQQLKDTLSLSDAQLAKVVAIYQDADQQRQKMMENALEDRDARMTAMRGLMQKTTTRIDSVLTSDQKVKFKEYNQRRLERMQQYRRD